MRGEGGGLMLRRCWPEILKQLLLPLINTESVVNQSAASSYLVLPSVECAFRHGIARSTCRNGDHCPEV
jgi:hypothetical protein